MKLKFNWLLIRRWLYRIGIILGLGIFMFQFVCGIQGLLRAPDAIRPVWMIGALGVLCAVRGLQMSAWWILMRGFGVNIRQRDLCENYTLSLLPRYIPGSVWGYLSRAEWLSRMYSTPIGLTNFISVIEACLVILSFLISTCLNYLTHSVNENSWISLFAIPILLYLPWRLFLWITQTKYSQTVFTRLSVVSENLRIAWKWWAAALALYILAWFGFGFAMWLLVPGLGLSSTSTWGEHMLLFGIAWLIGFLILFVPSGLGVREQTYAILLTSNIGMQTYSASLLSVVSRGLILFGEFIWLLIGLFLHSQTKKVERR